MTIDATIKTAKEGVSLVGEIIKAAGDDPNVKSAGTELGQSLLTITKTINNALLPLAAVNFAFDKARKYFGDKFQAEMAMKAAAIPPEQLVEPKASIAGPALQGLAFSHEEPSLKDMYLSLIATAMDARSADSAHPAFVEVIRQLNSEEAQLLSTGLRTSGGVPIVEIRLTTIGSGTWSLLYRHLLNLRDLDFQNPLENARLPAFVDNWIRLGLINVDYAHFLAAETAYDWIEKRPEYLHLKTSHEDDNHKLSFAKGRMLRTSFGEQFAEVVGLVTRKLP